MDNKIMLKGTTIQLLPFESKYWTNIAQWFYNEDYKGFFRQFTRMFTEADFQNYNNVIGGEVFMAHSLTDNSVIGLAQLVPCFKKNKACYIGIIIDKEQQNKRLTNEVMIILMDYIFNRQGYNKVIIEILESNESLKRCLEKTGFFREGKMLQECFMNGKFQNELRYSMSAYYYNKNKDKWTQEYKSWVDSLKV